VANERESIRSVKKEIIDILQQPDLEKTLEKLLQFPVRQAINALFSLLYHKNPKIKWHAVSGMGVLVSGLAGEDMGAAREVVRRLMWNLNDESGGIGWGSPEAMGEILASHHDLALEYAPILLSYAREDGNYQENVLMQCGVLWGIGRLASRRPELLRDACKYILPFLESSDGQVRGLSAWIAGMLCPEGAGPRLEYLKDDDHEVTIYLDGRIMSLRVKDLAVEALKRISSYGQKGVLDI
jgi:hypothetical protein